MATRIAEEMGETGVGGRVGYSIRFEDMTDIKTQLKLVTDGLLVREMMNDPLLRRYSVIIVDEAHERSVQTDLLLGLLKKVRRRRAALNKQGDKVAVLKLVVMSATIDAGEFARFFSERECTVQIMSVHGRQHPVDIFYRATPVSSYIDSAVQTAADIHRLENSGDILIFLTGQNEIERAVEMLKETCENNSEKSVLILPLYSGLTHERQLAVFEPAGRSVRKIIVSTNLAETSVTIEGVVYVIDCGFVKVKTFDSRSNTEKLVVAPISKASATQRAGRAGRVRRGACYRLFTEESFSKLSEKSAPEMERCNVSSVVLQLKALGVDNVAQFELLDAPPEEALARALELLFSLNAIDAEGRMTVPLGMQLAELPSDPCMSSMLLAGLKNGCSKEMVTVAAMLSIPNVFHSFKGSKSVADKSRALFFVLEGDHLTLLNVYNSFVKNKKSKKWCKQFHLSHRMLSTASKLRRQFVAHLKKYGDATSSKQDTLPILKSLVSGYFANAAALTRDGVTYETLRGGHQVFLHPNSVYSKCSTFPKFVLFHEIVHTTKPFMREVTEVNPDWLVELAPHFYQHQHVK